ncbi:subtilase [Trichoderma harzianum]|uniref:Subtilase n=1 Tax=Trichoderma harzianum TaxID=5544 RepID=A0A0G0AKJ7_TRIHA|nr:subtilase [Trichoderma harzianum]
MWQLELLSWVIPAFGALSKKFMESGPDPDLYLSAQDCYSDIISIGLVLSTSYGEWTSGLEDEQIGKLLKALESRFSNRWMPPIFNTPNKVHAYKSQGPPPECIFPPPLGVDADELDLSKHPSCGMRSLANKTYGLLERHWKCHCIQQASRLSGLREARLSLIIHRRLASEVAEQGITAYSCPQAKFEILLPVCQDNAEWKVTNVEVVKLWPDESISRNREPVNNDICRRLSKSRYFQVDLLAQNEELWHLTPRPVESVNHHTHMESLQQLLGDGISVSDISKYTSKDKLILCYVLANSMLFLYPGSWFQTAWSSDKIYFVRAFGNSTAPALTFPYLSIVFQQIQSDPPNHMQYHSHPAILALGIIFLEIATSVKFTRRSHELTSWEQSNSDGVQALKQLQELEHRIARDRSKRISQPASKLPETRELCLLEGRVGGKIRPGGDKASAEDAWFEWHTDALNQIEELRRPGTTEPQRVKIAILDSGIELSKDQKDMYDVEPKIQYRSWIEEGTEWKDEVGHGTHLAVLLRKVAPNAIIHVARVYKKRPHVEKSAHTIAEAIRYAVDDWKVDIIVMPFGFGSRNDIVYNSIKHAAFNDVLIFAAASNDGKNRPGGVAWPASESHVICVHSGDGHGNPSSFTPSPKENMRIMVLGECVRSAWPPKLKLPGDVKDMSGTSCAAPIAAGVAAVILDYAREFLSQKEWESFRQTDSMRRMFERLKDPDNHAGYWWVQHWGLFDSKRDESWIRGEIKGFLA